ncbi:hypothetical protein ACIRPX_36665 [Streptomyces sp. NPDC101225]|uniref:hypothetical protein n=1 Tax=Streptomyces sp. NPDC101225 TaxID=3366135 RepID=UPI00382B6816
MEQRAQRSRPRWRPTQLPAWFGSGPRGKGPDNGRLAARPTQWGAARCFFAETDRAAEACAGPIALRALGAEAAQATDGLEAQAHAEELDDQRRSGVDKAVGCLRAKLPYLGYDIARAEDWPIATSVIEEACRHPIKDRMNITGARWGLAGAEAVLKLRGVISNGGYEEYWEYHTQREHLRVHAIRYRDDLVLAA